MADPWDAEPARPGVVSRLLLPRAGAKPATLAFALGVVAVVAFVISLVLDWQRVTLTIPDLGASFDQGTDVCSAS